MSAVIYLLTIEMANQGVLKTCSVVVEWRPRPVTVHFVFFCAFYTIAAGSRKHCAIGLTQQRVARRVRSNTCFWQIVKQSLTDASAIIKKKLPRTGEAFTKPISEALDGGW